MTARTAAPTLRWDDGRPRVLMTDGWLTNAGDAAIALGTESLIRRHAPDASVRHAAYGADEVGDRYPSLSLVPPLEALVGTRWAPGIGALDLVAQADLIISQGGGFLREGYAPWGRIDALDRAAATGVPLVLLGQTIGRFDHAFARRSLGSVLRAATVVVVRDPLSVHHAVELGADRQSVIFGTDLALALAPQRSVTGPTPPRDPDAPVAVILTDHLADDGRADRAVVATDLLNAAVEAYPDRTIEVWSSAQGAGDDRDEHMASTIVGALPPKARARLHHHAEHVDAHQLVERTSRAATVLSMRLHPALLAAAQGTPALLLLEDQKAGTVAGTSLAGGTLARVADPPPADLGPLPDRLAMVDALLGKQLASPGTRP